MKLFPSIAPLVAALFISTAAHAATSAVAVTPQHVSVPGGEVREFAARFFDALGRPAVGETVQFVNDACGIFSNGSPVMSTRTDASGLASVQFVARNQGITCYVAANAGVTVRWDVLTFPMGLVHFQTQLTPPAPRPGEAFEVTVTPMAGAYRLYEADITAKIVAGDDASASISPGTLSTGQAGVVTFLVRPDHRVGEYQIELSYRSAAKRIPMDAPDAPWQDMWWGGATESGWGMSIVQHRDMLFSVIYAYDASGRPTWFVMPGGTWNAERTRYSGEIYSPRGTPFTSYDASRFEVGEPVGRASLNFVAGNTAELSYTIGETSATKMVTRQPLGPAGTPLTVDRGDMWWGGVAQNGWGMAMLQQYRTLFTVWFTYDAAGLPTWMVMPSGFWADPLTYEGRVYRTTGSPWLARAYDSSAFRSTDVGFFQFKFAADGTASFAYTVDGRSGTMGLSRQPF